jgi:hypothetical protein
LTCRACEEHGIDHEDIVKKCLSGPYWAGRILCNFDLLDNPFHEALSDWYVRKKQEGVNRFIVMTPRDHLKTSLFAIANTVWSLLLNPDEKILNVMASSGESHKTLDVVQRAFMGKKMQHFFPHSWLDPHHPDMAARKSSMILLRSLDVREASVEARGLDATMTGGHFTKQIFDDLIDNRIKDSIVEQEKAISFVQEATNMFVKPMEDERLIIGTLWEGEFYDWLLNKSGLADLYETLLIGCFVDSRYRSFLESIGKRTTLADGDPIWPEHFSLEALAQIEREEGAHKFRRQFINIPVEDDFKRFRPEDFGHYTISDDRKYCVIGHGPEATRIPVKRLNIRMIIDPATGEGKKTDETAINITGFDSVTGFAFVLEDWAARVLQTKLCDIIFELAEKWNVPVVSPEDVSYQKTLKQFLGQQMRDRKARFAIRPVKPWRNESKGSRIEALEPFVRAGQVFVRWPEHKKLVDEADKVVIQRGKVQGRSPNRLDAFAYHVENWTKKAPAIEKPEIEWWNPTRKEQTQLRAYGLACAT